MPLSIGQVLNDRYRVVALLGQGGFGAVYRVWDISFKVSCALKENTETSVEAHRQFEREAQMLHTLRHPNLPQVKDYFHIPGQGQYLVMDYVDGEDLDQKLATAGSSLPLPQTLLWIDQVCDALIYLHNQQPQVIHRDIKPANIKITPSGVAVLVDFGIAKRFDPSKRTTVGARAVTPGYSPFEQYGKAPTDARTDIYALGATLYALLTRNEPTDSIARMAGADLTQPRSLNAQIPETIERVILHAMQVMPDKRYQNVQEFKAELHKASAVFQVNTNSSVAGKAHSEVFATAKLVSFAEPAPWWPVFLQGLGLFLAGLLAGIALPCEPGLDLVSAAGYCQWMGADYQLIMRSIIGAYYLFFSALVLGNAFAGGRANGWKLIAGIVGSLAGGLAVTVAHPLWSSTVISDYVNPMLGGALLVVGALEFVDQEYQARLGRWVLGALSLIYSVIILAAEPITNTMSLSIVLAVPGLVGGLTVAALALFARK